VSVAPGRQESTAAAAGVSGSLKTVAAGIATTSARSVLGLESRHREADQDFRPRGWL
jgi:hypothetical protein